MPILKNPKHERFAQQLAQGKTADEAYQLAGYRENRGNAARMKANDSIVSRVAEIQGKGADKAELSVERVLREIQAMAFYDPASLVETAIKKPQDIGKLPEEVRRSIVGWSWDRQGKFVIKLADKSKALDQLARHLSIYNDKLDVNLTEGLAERLARAKGRG